MEAPEARILEIDEDWHRFEEVRRFVFDLLYGPFGVDASDDWFQPVQESIQVVAVSGGRIIGYARMLPPDRDGWRQIRQVSVAPELRGSGVGRGMMDVLVRRAAADRAAGVWVNARHDVVGFYELLGFVGEGDHFVAELTGIDHWRMRRGLR